MPSQQPSERKAEPKVAVKAKSLITTIKNSLFDSQRAETIPRTTAPTTSVHPSNSTKDEGFSVYGKEDEELPNFSFLNGSSRHDTSKLSHLYVTNTIDTSTTEGDGTEIILEDLAKEEVLRKKQEEIELEEMHKYG